MKPIQFYWESTRCISVNGNRLPYSISSSKDHIEENLKKYTCEIQGWIASVSRSRRKSNCLYTRNSK